jgi:hypothetical protein
MDLPPLSIEVLDVVSGSFARETVLDAFLRNPGMTWTAAGLSSWYRIRLDLVSAILSEFVEERIVSRSPGRPDRYTLSVEEQPLSNALWRADPELASISMW